jgi:hypothetical protein
MQRRPGLPSIMQAYFALAPTPPKVAVPVAHDQIALNGRDVAPQPQPFRLTDRWFRPTVQLYGLVGALARRLKRDEKFRKEYALHLAGASSTFEKVMAQLYEGKGLPVKQNALPSSVRERLTAADRDIWLEAGVFEQLGWQVWWCEYKDHLYMAPRRGRVWCFAHQKTGAQAKWREKAQRKAQGLKTSGR